MPCAVHAAVWACAFAVIDWALDEMDCAFAAWPLSSAVIRPAWEDVADDNVAHVVDRQCCGTVSLVPSQLMWTDFFGVAPALSLTRDTVPCALPP